MGSLEQFLVNLSGIGIGLAVIGRLVNRIKPRDGYRRYFINEIKKGYKKSVIRRQTKSHNR